MLTEHSSYSTTQDEGESVKLAKATCLSNGKQQWSQQNKGHMQKYSDDEHHRKCCDRSITPTDSFFWPQASVRRKERLEGWL